MFCRNRPTYSSLPKSVLHKLAIAPYSGKEDIIDTLTMAMLKKKSCVINYFSFMDEEFKKFRIDPLHFFESGGGLYLFVQVTRFQTIRILAVERIKKIEEIEAEFEYPHNFNPDDILVQAFDMVSDEPIELEVQFSADQAKYIKERRFSPSQEMVENPDGSLILKMETSGWFDVKKWLLSFGSSALVIKPEKMREAVMDEFRSGLKQYVDMRF